MAQEALLGGPEAEGTGFGIAMNGLNGGRLNIAACSLGGGQAVGQSLMLCSLVILPLSALLFWLALPSVRSIMASRTEI